MKFDLLKAMARMKEEFGNDGEVCFSQDDFSISIRLVVWRGDKDCWQEMFKIHRSELTSAIYDVFLDERFERMIKHAKRCINGNV